MSWCLNLPDGSAILGQWLYDWQTLIGGILALVAAWWASRLIQKQIKQAEQFNQDQIARSHNAARVVMPLALAEVSRLTIHVTSNAADYIEKFWQRQSDESSGELVSANVEPWNGEAKLSQDALSAFSNFVETLDRKTDVRHVAELTRSLQVLLSRYTTFDFSIVNVEGQILELMLQSGKVQMLADSMYNYCSFVDESSFGCVGTMDVADAWNRIGQATYSPIFLRPNLEQFRVSIDPILKRYRDNGTSPWNEKFEAW